MEASDWSKLSESSCARATAGWLAAERIIFPASPAAVSGSIMARRSFATVSESREFVGSMRELRSRNGWGNVLVKYEYSMLLSHAGNQAAQPLQTR